MTDREKALAIARLIRSFAAGIKPLIVMGVEESMYLTDHQEGRKVGLIEAAKLIEREFKP